MEKKPIKSNLFRFVTLRSPQLADDKKKEMLFVTYPENKKDQSKTIVAGKSAINEKEKVTVLKKVHEDPDFTPITSKVAYKSSKGEYNYYEKIHQFSNWLMRNKSSLSYLSIKYNIGEAKKLSAAKELLIWENLFYQTIHKTSVSVRESLLQILVANKFLKAFEEFDDLVSEPLPDSGRGREGGLLIIDRDLGNEINDPIVFSEEEKKEFTQLANASVVIPNEALFSLKKEVDNATSGMSSRAKNFLKKTAIVDAAKTTLKNYEVALKEIERAEIVYNKEEAKKHQEALSEYTTKVEEIKEKAPVMREVVDSDTGVKKQIETYPELETLKIQYKRSPEINRLPEGTAAKRSASEARVISQLSPETQGLINSPDFEIYDSFNEVKSTIQDTIKAQNQVIFDNTPVGIVNQDINGENLVLNVANEVPLYSYTISLSSTFLVLGSSFNFGLKIGENLRAIKEASYEILDSGGAIVTSGTTFRKQKTASDDYLNFGIFDQGLILGEASYILKGELTLSDNTVLSFNSGINLLFSDGPYSVLEGSTSGLAIVKEVAGVTMDGDDDVNDKNIYGVTQLGIADFRRVEQEVCCYVPGEVSHIENIMAREYKERTTRNLNSYEATNENTTEREAEVLTDTTSTQRNELQNEASSVVNEDNSTSFGANASVSGNFLGGQFSAGSNFNTASNSSTSNSNLQAQTYAQEVTERALERVVEKVSSKRTSRILKEHEENNTHGFDNRKGNKHVTGVYRWVDIIYKNKLINYGKRLMYEFAIPEPAKFFIDAIQGGVNDSNKENKLIIPKEPKHPSKFTLGTLLSNGLLSPTNLDEYNYQRIAAEYNAEVKPVPKLSIRATKGFGSNYYKGGEKQGWLTSEVGEIDIPEGYEVNEARASVNYHFHNDDREYPSFSIQIGGKSFSKHYSESHPRLSNFDGILFDGSDIKFKDLGGVRQKLGIAYESYDTGTIAISVSAVCSRTKEYYEQWQNETYKAIIDAYNERVQEYNEFQFKEVEDVEVQKKKEFSSQLNRAIEKREIKRIAVNLLTAPFKDSLTVSKSHYSDDATTIPNRAGLNNHAEVVKFFEQAFDWEIMAYTFYPYFYKARGEWGKSFDYTEGNDPIFKAFLQSGMARSVVPVRPGFEDAVNWFMNTGEIWNGQGMVTDTEDDLYVSVAEEMQTVEGEVEGTWETRVPTALTILQADSVVLEEGGLPCGEECKEHSTFKSAKNTLGGGTSADPEGVDFDVVEQTNDVR